LPTPLRLLLAEDSEDDALLLVRRLRQADYDVTYERIDSAPALERALESNGWDIIISDYNMPSFTGLDALKIVRSRDADIPMIFVSGSIGEDVAVAAMRAGAQDYVMKGNLPRLAPAIARELREVRERKRLRAQFLQAQKMEAVGQLAGGIAHDFNNLLTVITSYSDFLLEDLAEDDVRREEVLQIRSAANAATSLSRQLLVFSRTSDVIQPQVAPLNNIATEAVSLLKRLIGADIQLVVNLDKATGSVEVDPGLLAQVVLNLAINARDAMPSGGKLIIETYNSDDEGPHATLAVSDSGSGMTAETQARMFEPFFTTKAPGKGTGLGLAMVYSVVKQYRGVLNVYSEPNVGTTFKIHLPRTQVPADQPDEVITTAEELHGNEVILVVEDAAAVRTVARQVLERFGYTVLEAPDGATALHLAARYHGPIDLLLTDVVMPVMSGRSLAAQFNAVRPQTRVLFASGYTDDAALHLGVLEEGVQYLQKPFTPEALARKVRQALENGATVAGNV
jgi:two-component system, cell cycle sensor histidine kinase and response regulator CckA